jgi:gas vesicle protein
MADGYDRFDNEGSSGSSFVMGLLTGTVLGAGLGMLFAPRSGSELRHQISGQAGNLANTASEGYRRAAETAGDWAEKGREVGRDIYGRAREAVSRGAEEAHRYINQATEDVTSTATTGGGQGAGGFGSGYPTENVRGATSEGMRGASGQGATAPGGTPSTPRRS